MSRRQITRKRWRELGITAKFGMLFGAILALIMLIGITGYAAFTAVRSETETAIVTSTRIQYLVLEMDRRLHEARRLAKDFFLWYPIVGYSEAYKAYAQKVQKHIKQVRALSAELQQLIIESDVSEALRQNRVNLNLYTSAAQRYAATVDEAADLVAKLVNDETGLQAKLAQQSSLLQGALQEADDPGLVALYRKMQSFEKDYWLTRQRPLMQSAINVAIPLRSRIELAPTLDTDQKAQAITYLDGYLKNAEQIPQLDASIHSKFSEFDLQTEAIDPVSEGLIALASEEIRRANTEINQTSRLATVILVVTILIGIVLVSIIAKIFSKSITSNVIKLTQVAGEFHAGNLEVRTRIDSGDEIGQLADTFNTMATRIASLVGNLEQQVGARTAELTKTNEQLQQEVTERNILEEQFIQAQKMEAIGTLTGGIAHDFNNLLTTIIGNADMALMAGGKDDPLREGLEEIKAAGNRAAVMTNQLLAFSRKQVIQPCVLCLNEVVIGLEKMLGRLIGEDMNLKAIQESALWNVEADPGQMEQVIVNLVVNARDAMPRGGNLTIETANVDLDEAYFNGHGVKKMSGSYVMLAISDTGIGMDEETRSRIFDPFFTTKEKGKGTGLGLSTVYGIVKQSEGYIWAYSEPGQGTTFKVYLPKVEKDVVLVEKAPIDTLEGSETVLVVEDDDSVRKMTRKILQRFGYEVLEAREGEEALKVIKEYEGPIQLMLTDVVMPGMSGRDLSDSMQALRPEVKVIYMSGYTDDAIGHHGVLEPGLNFIEKPFTPESVARKVREVLDA